MSRDKLQDRSGSRIPAQGSEIEPSFRTTPRNTKLSENTFLSAWVLQPIYSTKNLFLGEVDFLMRVSQKNPLTKRLKRNKKPENVVLANYHCTWTGP